MQAQDPDFRTKTLAAVADQPFAALLGMEAIDAGVGWFEVGLDIGPQHTQHDGIVHGGTVASLADTAVALAALTLIKSGERVVTIEFKINFLAPARGALMRGVGRVVRAGRTISVSQGEASVDGTPCATMLATMILRHG